MSGALQTSSWDDGFDPADPWTSEGIELPLELGGYRLEARLGHGGMGAVFEAEQLATGRRLALKMLAARLDSPEMRERFLLEGRLAARVHHPNCLFVFGSEQIDGFPVIAMEIATGGTLEDRLREHGPLPVPRAVDATLDIVAGLQAALAEGVLHRDVKPSNCFTSPDGSVKVGDFGLAVAVEGNPDPDEGLRSRVVGTPGFSSPEQLRGEALDVRSDIYSVGATLFALLTSRVPAEQAREETGARPRSDREPAALEKLRDDVPPGLAKVVARCLAREPSERFPDHRSLADALLPFSSRRPVPASVKLRAAAGWVDYLVALLPPYLAIMLSVGAEALIVRPLVDRTLYAARYHIALLAVGMLYFTVAEGLSQGGIGKRLKGLRVIRRDGRRPGLVRALIRAGIPFALVEGVRMPLMLALISDAHWSAGQTAGYVAAAVGCGWIPMLFALGARRENGYATLWDIVSGTRVVVAPRSSTRTPLEFVETFEEGSEPGLSLGPYRITRTISTGRWLVGLDPVLRRPVWLLKRVAEPSHVRKNAARPGRLRWLQRVQTDAADWDVFEAVPGAPLISLTDKDRRVPWSTLRHWLDDVSTELQAAAGDGTLPVDPSVSNVWISARGRALLLDAPWPATELPARCISVENAEGQLCFLRTVAGVVDTTSLPLHASTLIRDLDEGRFGDLGAFSTAVRRVLDRPSEVSRGARAGSLYLLPAYLWTAVFVGYYHDKQWGGSSAESVLVTALFVAAVLAVIDLVGLPFRSTVRHVVFRLAVVDASGRLASRSRLLLRWSLAWLPLLVGLLSSTVVGAVECGLAVLGLWLGASALGVVHPGRGMHDRLAGTWVVRR